MTEFKHLTEQKKIENLKESIPNIVRLKDETKRLMKLVKKGKYHDSNMLDVHSLIKRAKEHVKQLKESEGIDGLEETIPEIRNLQAETKRLMKLVQKSRSKNSNMLDIDSLITLAKDKVEQLTNDEKIPRDT